MKQKELPQKNLTPDEKIWVVIKEIYDATLLAPKDDFAVVEPQKLESEMLQSDHEQIFKKLVADYKFITVKQAPYIDFISLDSNSRNVYKFKVYDLNFLKQLLDEYHNKYFSSLSKLSGNNFLSVVDVSRDISDALQMTDVNEVKIPIWQALLKFPNLCPIDTVNFRDKYCDLRWQACCYLKNNGYIEDFNIKDKYGHRWEYQITITLDRLKWHDFYKKLSEKAKKRIVYESELKKVEKERLSEPKDIQKITEEAKREIPQTRRPHCVSESGIGYLQFGKFGEKVEIGRETSQPYKLLLCTIEPFGVAKKVDAVFEAIRENVKEKNKGGIYTTQLDKNKKIELIKFAIKELQKESKLRGKLQFKWDNLETKLWLEYIG